MSVRLVQYLARCDFESLTPLLGDATITLLKRVGTEAVNPEGLAFLVVSVLGEEGALRNKTVRQLLFSKLNIEEGRQLCELLQLPTSAAAMTLNSINFDVNPSYLEKLTLWFAVPYDATDITSRETEGSRKAVASHKLKTHQLTAFRKLRLVISKPSASALIHMPFGAGKLRLVATAVLDLYRSEPDGQVIVWLTPGEALCDEAFSELRSVWEHLGSRDITIYRFYGNRKIPDLGSLENCIIVADIAKIHRAAADLSKLGIKTRVVILGDASHVAHPAGAKILNEISKNSSFSLIGMSASSGSTISADPASGELNTRFSDSYITMECDEPLELLREAGDIGRLIVEVHPTTWGTALSDEEDSLEFDEKKIEAFSKDVERNHALLELLLKESSNTQGNIVFYATTADHARLFAGLLALRGIPAMSVTGDTSPGVRHRVIQKFHAQHGKILCAHGFFISGSSIPRMSVAIIASPTLSESVFHGMIGRLTGFQDAEENHLKIIVVADSIPKRANPHGALESWSKLDFTEL